MEKSITVTLQLLPQTYSILKFPPHSSIPDWALKSDFCSITKTFEELSIVCKTPTIINGEFKQEGHWRCFRIAGTLDFSLTGILNSVTTPLARAKISLFAISTYDTDYFLIKDEKLAQAIDILSKNNFKIKTSD